MTDAELPVLTPVPGTVVALADVPDPVFAQGIVGAGIAVQPSAEVVDVVAPIAGTVFKLHPHAVVLLGSGARGILVHLGIDTVQLHGAGFELLVAEGETVTVGQPLVRYDVPAVVAAGKDPIIPVVALDVTADSLRGIASPGPVAAGATVFTLPAP